MKREQQAKTLGWLCVELMGKQYINFRYTQIELLSYVPVRLHFFKRFTTNSQKKLSLNGITEVSSDW